MENAVQGSNLLTRTTLGGTEVERRAETAATAAAAHVRAKLEFQFGIAIRQPRDWEMVRLRILKECERPAFAREALYNKPIGEGVTGLSIRFAEKALMCMGNLDVSTIVTFDSEEKRIVSQVITDLETNVSISKDVTINKTVERRKVKEGQEVIGSRMNSKNELVYLVIATEDELLNKEGALVSKAMRTNLLRILPGDIQAEAETKISLILATQDAQDPEGRKKSMLNDFFRFGVKPAEIAQVLGLPNMQDAVLSPAQLQQCRGLFNAIKDGETSIQAAIEHALELRGEKPAAGAGESKPSTTAAKVKDKISKKKAADPEPPATAPMTVVTTEEHNDPVGGRNFDPKSVAAKLQNALIDLAQGNIAAGEIHLSSATGGKIQQFTALVEALEKNPGWAEMIDHYIARHEEANENE